MISLPGSPGNCSVSRTVARQDQHTWLALDLDGQNKEADPMVTGIFTTSSHRLIDVGQKTEHWPDAPPSTTVIGL